MDLTIARCYQCKKARLVDRVNGKYICLACKQKVKKLQKMAAENKRMELSA